MNTKKANPFFFALKALILAVSVGVAGFVLFFAATVLKLDSWREFDPEKILGAPQTLIIYDKNDREAARLHAQEDRMPVEIESIPEKIRMAFISAEDARFYDHPGVDLIRIAGAAWQDIKAGSYVQGASTITQQLIKLSHLSADKTISRKLEEAVLAYQMEKRFSKDEILEMYLNYVYFGRGYYGIESAAQGYFGVSAEDLTIAQAAALAGILKSPANYAPHLNREKSLARRNHILGLMERYGHISSEEKARAVKEEMVIQADTSAFRGYYVDAVLADASELLSVTSDDLLTEGYRIYSFLDVPLQETCESLFEDDSFFPAPGCEGAIVVLDVKTGTVSALVGGREQNAAMTFNRAVEINRQPGSVIKPIISYAPALEHCGYTASSMLLDEPTSFADYSPENFSGKYYGWVTLREAVQRSLNVPAVKVLNEIGVKQGKDFSSSVGIEFDEEDTSLALALGGFTYGVSPIEIAGAYGTFAANGVYKTPSLIKKIESSEGECLYEYDPSSKKVMRAENAFILTSMLESAIKEGTGRRLGDLGIPLAGKTGTVGNQSGNRDAWMAAYNSEYAACVWMGFDSDADGFLPTEVTGGTYPAIMLRELFSHIYPDQDAAPQFETPEGVIEVDLDAHTLAQDHKAVLANTFTPKDQTQKEIFLKGTEPTATTEYWGVPYPVKNLAVGFSSMRFPVISFYAPQSFVRYSLFRENTGTGETVYIKSWVGESGNMEFTDQTVINGESYRYSVVPEHPELKVNGDDLKGPVRHTQQVYIRKAELFLEDTEFFMIMP